MCKVCCNLSGIFLFSIIVKKNCCSFRGGVNRHLEKLAGNIYRI